MNFIITKKRIRFLKIPQEINMDKLQIYVPVYGEEAQKVGLVNVGDEVLPSAKFGPTSRRNAYGYSFSDKTKDKEYRYITTNYIYPYGNTNTDPQAVDIYRYCWRKVFIQPFEINLTLCGNGTKNFVMVVLSQEIKNNYLKEAVNLMLEIYGKCYISDGELDFVPVIKRKRCNWVILPPGEKPSNHLKNFLRNNNNISKNEFDKKRLLYLESFKPKSAHEGINGFNGYYAYIFNNTCFLESALYGNATYIIPKENWEMTSQKTKKEITENNMVIKKIVHNAAWFGEIKKFMTKMKV